MGSVSIDFEILNIRQKMEAITILPQGKDKMILLYSFDNL